MKNTPRFYAIFWVFAVFFFICLTVHAHPGRTDSNGGHTDHSTGEYHYHHGYSAHDHYDMDGDGVIDCPYNFDDQTDHNPTKDSSINNTQCTEPSSDSLEIKRKVSLSEILTAMIKYLFPSVLVSLLASHLLSYLFFIIWGDDKGCSVTFVSFIVLSIVAYLLLIIFHFRNL